MSDTEREGLKEQLRAMAAGRGDGIDLDSTDRWVVEGLKDPIGFFQQLNLLIPTDSILYFEGCEIVPEVAQFYERNRASNAVPVVRDTISPIPETFHVVSTPAFVAELTNLLNQHSVEKCFYHVKAYCEEKLLFTFHDAFDGSDFHISDRITEDCVRAFSSSLGVVYRRERNENNRDPEQLHRILRAIENSGEFKISQPWWKKLLPFWKS
jgi:hypothetical protein